LSVVLVIGFFSVVPLLGPPEAFGCNKMVFLGLSAALHRR
jgi:hypothetical protein